MLKINKTLVHLDLSFNKMSYSDTELIAEDVKENHTLYGLHF